MSTFNSSRIRKPLLSVAAGLALALIPFQTGAQCDKPSKACMNELADYLSDGQPYAASIAAGGTASFKMSLYEGFTYRIVACTDVPGAQIRYTVYDSQRRAVFTHVGTKSGSYWDFEIGSSDNFTIKASLTQGTGCVVFALGYDETMNLDDDNFSEEDDPFYEDELSDDDYGLEEED